MNRVISFVDYQEQYRVFDMVFIISALGSIGIICLNMKLRQNKYNSYLEEDKVK